MTADVMRIAQNLAHHSGYAVFPCREADKRPATEHGFKDAESEPDAIARLWRRCPGDLIGVATGERSGVSVLDVDVKHNEARRWWAQHEIRLPTTRAFRTRGGGVHLYFRHAPGVRNVNGKPTKGVDVRGDGGYGIYWFAHGFECLDHSPPAAWPHWLTTYFWPPKPQRQHLAATQECTNSAAVDGLIRFVRDAEEGSRNGKLNWAAYRMREKIGANAIGGAEARRRLLDAALECGLPVIEAERTIASAWGAST